MRLLVIEYIAPIEHVGYVSYHLNCLKSLGHSITFYTHKEFFNACDIDGVTFKAFPSFLHCRTRNRLKPLLERVQGLIKMLILKGHLLFNQYDAIIFTSYDILSFCLYNEKTKTFIINHNNTSDFSHSIKRFLHGRVRKNIIYVALAPFIKDFIESYVNNRVEMIPHGLTKSYLRIPSKEKQLYGGSFIYIPTTSSCNEALLNIILNDGNVVRFLKDNNIRLVIKSYTITSKDDSIVVLSEYIGQSEYKRIMGETLAIFAPYNENSFQYRVSAMLMECFGSGIPILSSKTNSYLAFSEFFNYPFLVDSPESFINSIAGILDIKDNCYYKNLNVLDPQSAWELVLN